MPTMIITGASTGVGRAIALHFAHLGWQVDAIARASERLAALAAEHEHITTHACDLTHSEAVRSTFAAIAAARERIDVLINNAGVHPGTGEITFELIDRVIDTNLKATMYATYAVLPDMRAAGGGRIVNICSIAGEYIQPGGDDGLYAASKHGQTAFGDSLGRQVRSDGILVTNISPGGIDTPLWNEDFRYPFAQSGMIRPQEIAELVDYILRQPARTLFKTISFVPTQETW